jgi:hypothetical protein
MGFPGDEAVDMDVPATIGGILDNCRLDDADERCISREDDMESDRAAFESRIFWNRVRAADVLRVAASTAAALTGFKRSFLKSKSLRKSDMFSSSVWRDSPLLPAGSAKIPDPGWALEEVALAFPLDMLSSSIRTLPPEDNLPRR